MIINNQVLIQEHQKLHKFKSKNFLNILFQPRKGFFYYKQERLFFENSSKEVFPTIIQQYSIKVQCTVIIN